jgi:hypothetical protein
VRVVEAPDLAACRAELEPVTSMHVHSVMPNQPGDVAFVANEDYLQVGFVPLRLWLSLCLHWRRCFRGRLRT